MLSVTSILLLLGSIATSINSAPTPYYFHAGGIVGPGNRAGPQPTTCIAGQYNFGADNYVCIQCPSGTYNTVINAWAVSSCLKCINPKCNPATGICVSLLVLLSSAVLGSPIGAPGGNLPVHCGLGQYCNRAYVGYGPGANPCTACPVNQFNNIAHTTNRQCFVCVVRVNCNPNTGQ